jgi:16S rRNA (adenine1518-N6/adenine1519-N6)-dimethyltransferase
VTVELLRRADVVAILEGGGRHPRKQLGQNFVVDPGTIRRIVRAAGVEPGDRVLEVGPGLGSLTLGLLEAGAEVTCIEKDPEMARLLEEILSTRAPGARVRILVGDALDVDLGSVASPGSWRLVSNLPYNVSTQIVLRVLDVAPAVATLLVMVQREVGERWVAAPGSRVYGIPSVLIALDAVASLAGSVAPEVFYPRPRVASTLVALRRRPDGRIGGCDISLLRELVRRGFGQRRKTLRRSLALDDPMFAAAAIDPSDRPEQLAVDDWCRLAAAVGASGGVGHDTSGSS